MEGLIAIIVKLLLRFQAAFDALTQFLDRFNLSHRMSEADLLPVGANDEGFGRDRPGGHFVSENLSILLFNR